MSALVRWLPELAVASADDIARFGPQAARVRTLLDFIPTMSEDAARVGGDAWWATRSTDEYATYPAAYLAARGAAGNAAGSAARDAAWGAAEDAAEGAAYNAARGAARDAAGHAVWVAAGGAGRDAAMGEVVSNLISPENYRMLTNPLAAGRAVDVLRPRYKNTQFRELLQELAPKRVITQPSDVLGVGRIASLPDEVAIREAIDLVANYGMTFEEALNVIRMV